MGLESKGRGIQAADQYGQTSQDDNITELSTLGIEVPRDELNKAECLRIEVIEGPEANRGTNIDINAQGRVGSQRGKKDGCVIFGSL